MRSVLSFVLLAAAIAAGAQEGFPLDGTWRGQREGSGTVVLVMQWDGQKITGVINPGPKAISFDDAQLIPQGWRVTISAHSSAGEKIAFEGVIGNLGAYDRTLTGTWTEGGRSDTVRLVRE